jgi:NAD(P)-dependent dehydrogenase (short-subunit alcohol dehydrogenase family)
MLKGRVAVVTGGASGLGRAVARRMLHNGVRVAVVDITGATEDDADGLGERFREFRSYRADVSVQEQTREVASRIAHDFGQIDVLINAAGIIRRTDHVRVNGEELEAVLRVNLEGTVFMCQAAHPFMTRSGGGAIVNFTSMLAHYGSRNLLSYAASKGGVVQVTKCLAVDWARDNIRVNAVSPGYIETPLSSGATKDPAFQERILSRTPQRRFGTPEEVAAVVEFLASNEASFITGVVLPVDGGLLAGDPSLFPPETGVSP